MWQQFAITGLRKSVLTPVDGYRGDQALRKEATFHCGLTEALARRRKTEGFNQGYQPNKKGLDSQDNQEGGGGCC
jgi:hypothetical protein